MLPRSTWTSYSSNFWGAISGDVIIVSQYLNDIFICRISYLFISSRRAAMSEHTRKKVCAHVCDTTEVASCLWNLNECTSRWFHKLHYAAKVSYWSPVNQSGDATWYIRAHGLAFFVSCWTKFTLPTVIDIEKTSLRPFLAGGYVLHPLYRNRYSKF